MERRVITSKQTEEDLKKLEKLAKERGVIPAGTVRTSSFPPIQAMFPTNASEFAGYSVCRVGFLPSRRIS